MFSFFASLTEKNEIKSNWEKIEKSIQSNYELNDLNALNEKFKSLTKSITDELELLSTNKINISKSTGQSSLGKLEYFFANNILAKIAEYSLNSKESRVITLEYLSKYLDLFKYQKELLLDNTSLMITLQKLILSLQNELLIRNIKFNYKNEFSLLLNSLTRIILNYPSLLSYFTIKTNNSYSKEEYNDYIIFSNLLRLLEIDGLIRNYEYKKYIRRSLIVSLSFDEINKDENYLLNESFFIEMLINKLCNYYQMLPRFFEIDKNSKTLDPAYNIKIKCNCFVSIYYEFKDYLIFLNKIINCLTSEAIKNKFDNNFFKIFLIENVLPNLLSSNVKILRSHLQYILTLLYNSKNNQIIINNFFVFLFDSSKKNDESEEIYDKIKKIKIILLKNISNNIENINIIIYELFCFYFEQKPYLMIKKYIKPYTDYVVKNTNNKTKYILGDKTSYPISNQIMNLLSVYSKYHDINLAKNINCSMFRNFSYYITRDIDFYNYYLNEKQKKDTLLNQESHSVVNRMSSFRINPSDSFSEEVSKTDSILEDNISKGLNPLFLSNLMTSKKNLKSKKNENMNENIIVIQDLFENDIDFFNKNDFNVKENENEIENIIFMKNLHHKLVNFINNTNIENILILYIINVIISIPKLSFDSDLIQCNLVLVDNDEKSRYSFLTVFKYYSQYILRKLENSENSEKFKNILKEFGLEKCSEEFKVNLDFNGFNANITQDENKEKSKIINWVIFCEFIKEFISCISHKYKFEELVENLFEFYSEQLDEYYSDSRSQSNNIGELNINSNNIESNNTLQEDNDI